MAHRSNNSFRAALIRRLRLLVLLLVALVASASAAQTSHPAAQAAEPAPELSAAELSLHKRFGAQFLAQLRELGVLAKDFLYAEKLARVGLKNLDKRELGDAIYLFNKAYGLVKSPNVLLYLARTYEQLGSYLKARRHLQRFIAEAGRWTLTEVDRSKVERARRQAGALERRLVGLALQVRPDGVEVFVNGETAGKTPLRGELWLMPGASKVVLVKEGYVKQELSLKAVAEGTRLRRSVRLQTPEQAVRANRLFRQEAERKLQLQLKITQQQDRFRRRGRSFRTAGLITAGVGAASLLTGVVFGALAQHNADQVEQAPRETPWEEIAPSYTRFEDYRTTMLVTTGVGSGLLVAGGAMLFYGYWSTRNLPAEERAGSSSAGLQIVPLAGADRLGLALGLSL